MATLTINNASNLEPPNFEPLIINFNVTAPGGAGNTPQETIWFSNGTPVGSSIQTYNYPPPIILNQPLIWNLVDFTPDKLTINSIVLNLGTGASGTLFVTESDNVTPITLPKISTPIPNPGPFTILGKARILDFISGSTNTNITINITVEDTVEAISISKNIRYNYNNI